MLLLTSKKSQYLLVNLQAMTARKCYTFCSSLSPYLYLFFHAFSIFTWDHHVKTFQSKLLEGWRDRHYTLWNNWWVVHVIFHTSWKWYPEQWYSNVVFFSFVGKSSSLPFFFFSALHQNTAQKLYILAAKRTFLPKHKKDERVTSENAETKMITRKIIINVQ